MAKALEIQVIVRDAASSTLKKITGGVKELGKATNQTSVNFKEFNRVLFSTTAFMGIFTKAFSSFANTIAQGADLDRLTGQFEQAFGPRSEVLKNLQEFSGTTVDQVTFMKEAISLKSLGIAKDFNSVRNMLVKAGIAAKKAGLDSADGMKYFSEFQKTGSIANLSFLNLLAATNPALKAQLAILEKAGGTLGSVISMQAKLNLGMSALNAAVTENDLKMHDLMDSTRRLGEAYKFLKGNIGSFIGKALQGLIDKTSLVFENFNALIERVGKIDKTFGKSIGKIIETVAAFTGLIAVLGTLRLSMMAISALGIGGIPFLTAAVLALGAAFSKDYNPLSDFLEIFKKVGAVFFGVGQLVFSFINNSDNFKKGVGVMDKELNEFLAKHGLLELTENIARVTSIITIFAKQVASNVVTVITKLSEAVKYLSDKFEGLFGKTSPGAWSKEWITSGNSVLKVLAGIATVLLGLRLGKGILGSVGGIFGLGRGLGRAPKGSANDPVYTRSTDALKISTSELGADMLGATTALTASVKLLPIAIGTAIGLYLAQQGKNLGQDSILFQSFSVWTDKIDWIYSYLTGKKSNYDSREDASIFGSRDYLDLNNSLIQAGVPYPNPTKVVEAVKGMKGLSPEAKSLRSQATVESFKEDAGVELESALKLKASLLEEIQNRGQREAFERALNMHPVLTSQDVYNSFLKAMNAADITQLQKEEKSSKKTDLNTLVTRRC